MKIKKVGKLLKKLNNLYDNIKDDNSISSIEKDLFLSYVKELYEHATGSEVDPTEEATPPPVVASPSPVVADREPVPTTTEREAVPTETAEADETARREEERSRREQERSARQAERAAREAKRRQQEEERQTSVDPSPAQAETPMPTPPSPEPVAAKVAEPQAAVAAGPTVAATSEPAMSDEMKELFTVAGIKEVSDRLRMQPISDMNRCMGINERIFTIRELFGNQDGVFNETMDHLNTLGDFDSAKDYLATGVASKYSWDEDSRSKKAGNFIKLVYRRYL
jgi:hypothetical protein